MCGRYATLLPPEAMRAVFRTVNPPPHFTPSWNMAPSRLAPVVRLHPETRARHLDLLRWGLVPHWVKDPGATRQPINARGETAAQTPMFRDAFARRHCLVPADAFYEWQALGGAQQPSGQPTGQPPKQPTKQPWAITRADAAPLVFAGLWEGWRGADGAIIRSFTILTTAACAALRDLHERMPVILEEPDWPLWLGESAGDAAALLRPSDAPLRRWMVSRAVNNVRNDSAALLDPV